MRDIRRLCHRNLVALARLTCVLGSYIRIRIGAFALARSLPSQLWTISNSFLMSDSRAFDTNSRPFGDATVVKSKRVQVEPTVAAAQVNWTFDAMPAIIMGRTLVHSLQASASIAFYCAVCFNDTDWSVPSAQLPSPRYSRAHLFVCDASFRL